jgi:hypothetical protein
VLCISSLWTTSKDEPVAKFIHLILKTKEPIDQDKLAYHNEPFTKEDYAEAAIDNLKHQFLVIERNSLLEDASKRLLSSSSGWAGLIVIG